MTCDGCMFLSLSLKIDSILRVCQMIKKLKFHLVYVFSFLMNLLLSTSFLLQNGRRIPILVLSSNQWTGIIVSSPFGFSKSWITSFTNLAARISRFDEWLFDDSVTSSFQFVAIYFARCKAPRMVLRFHLSGMANFQCTCSFPGF